jgi:hypothetical protein
MATENGRKYAGLNRHILYATDYLDSIAWGAGKGDGCVGAGKRCKELSRIQYPQCPGYTDGCRSLMPALDKPYGAAVETGRLEAHPQLLSVAHSAATCCFATPTGTDSDQDVTDSRGRVWNSPSIANLNTSWRQRSDLAIVGGLLFEGNHTVERHRHFDALAGSDCTWSIHCLLMVTPL